MLALNEGRDVRLTHWPAGTFLRKNGERINVYKNNRFAAPDWYPSSSEPLARNWEIIN